MSTTNPTNFDADIRNYAIASLLDGQGFIVVTDLLLWAGLPVGLDLDSQCSLVSRIESVAKDAHCKCPACHGEGFVAEAVRYDDSPALLGDSECSHCDGAGILNAKGDAFAGRVVWSHVELEAMGASASSEDLDVAAE